MSFLLTCPNCGVREVSDFGFGGESSKRPTEKPATLRELGEYNYFRRNTAGVQREWWVHRSGCRAWFLAEREHVARTRCCGRRCRRTRAAAKEATS